MSRNKREVMEDLVRHTVLDPGDFTAEPGQLSRPGLLKLERLLRGDKVVKMEKEQDSDYQNHIQSNYKMG